MSDIINKVDNLEIELDDNSILSNLFGFNDANLKIIEEINKVKIQYRGNKIKISGNKSSILETKLTLLDLFEEAKKGEEIDEDKVRDSKSILSMKSKKEQQTDLFIQTKKKKIIPRTSNQNIYFEFFF